MKPAMTPKSWRLNHADERPTEIAEILAVGLQRALAPKSSEVCGHGGESSLHILPDQSGHPAPVTRRNSDG